MFFLGVALEEAVSTVTGVSNVTNALQDDTTKSQPPTGESMLPELPEGWEWASVGEVSDRIQSLPGLIPRRSRRCHSRPKDPVGVCSQRESVPTKVGILWICGCPIETFGHDRIPRRLRRGNSFSM